MSRILAAHPLAISNFGINSARTRDHRQPAAHTNQRRGELTPAVTPIRETACSLVSSLPFFKSGEGDSLAESTVSDDSTSHPLSLLRDTFEIGGKALAFLAMLQMRSGR